MGFFPGHYGTLVAVPGNFKRLFIVVYLKYITFVLYMHNSIVDA
jgi:hypothetical protein